jgi:lipid-binding SYLF domain-containing protein
MWISLRQTGLSLLLTWLLVAVAGADAGPNPKQLVGGAWTALGNFLDDPEQGQFRAALPKAKAMLIVPELVQAGFIVGGAGGAGTRLARQPGSAAWSQPAFVTIGGPSLGLQAGAEVSQVIYLVMTDTGLKSLLTNKVQFGTGVRLAAGSGGGTGEVNADILSFARGKGLYAGVVGKGLVVEMDLAAAKLFYGRAVSAEEILIKKQVYNREAGKLVALVAKAASPPRR